MNEIILSTSPEKRFAQLERIIEKGMKHFMEVGTALQIIKKEKLYKETLGFKNFEEYCKERWGFSKTHANRFIASARVTENLTPIGVKPTSESQTRPLAPLEPDQQKEVWDRTVETAPQGKITARHVEETVKEYLNHQNESEEDETVKFFMASSFLTLFFLSLASRD